MCPLWQKFQLYFYYIHPHQKKKNSYEFRDYESVDKKNYLRLCPEKRREK